MQAIVGDAADRNRHDGGRPCQLLEANVDDVTGEVLAHTIAALHRGRRPRRLGDPDRDEEGSAGSHGARACATTPPSTPVRRVLIARRAPSACGRTAVRRWPQRRTERVVEIDGHTIRVKVGDGRVKVEHDDALAVAASALGRPLRDVLATAEHLGRSIPT